MGISRSVRQFRDDKDLHRGKPVKVQFRERRITRILNKVAYSSNILGRQAIWKP